MATREKIYDFSPVVIQELLVNVYGIYIHFERFGRSFWKSFEELNNTQWYSEAELGEYQKEKLRVLIHHAYETVPYYRRVMKERRLQPSDIRTESDLVKLPILTRNAVKNNLSTLLSTKYKKHELIEGHTSGTTGSPLKLYWDLNLCRFHNAADWRQKAWAGFVYREGYAVLQGRTIVPLGQRTSPYWRMNYIHNQLFLSSFHLKKHNLTEYLRKLREFRPKVLEGYPSAVYILAKYLVENGEVLPLQAVLTSSETLYSIQREVIEQAFACRIFDFYGSAERVIFATECDRHEGHHLNLEYGIAEVVDQDGLPVRHGTPGRIIATGLHNFAMPLIRYDTGDSTTITERTCSCRRALPLIEDITTKNKDMVVLENGSLVSPSALTYPIRQMYSVEECQIVQEDFHRLRVLIVKGCGYKTEDTCRLLSALRQIVGNDMKVSVEFVGEIPRSQAGKFHWVVSKVTSTCKTPLSPGSAC